MTFSPTHARTCPISSASAGLSLSIPKGVCHRHRFQLRFGGDQQADHLERQNGSLGLVVADADIQRAAEELVERYGDSALAVAQERVEALSNSQDQSGLNVALRVLSAVETLLASKPK